MINGTDRTPGAGFAHLKVFDGNGTLIADATVSEPGSFEYHTGGIYYNGGFIWETIAQCRPNTTCHMICIDPKTLSFTTLIPLKLRHQSTPAETRVISSTTKTARSLAIQLHTMDALS
jgi:hypothetical protein